MHGSKELRLLTPRKLILIFASCAFAAASEPTALHAPQPSALEKQQASLLVQRDSVDRQLSTIRPQSPRSEAKAARSLHAGRVSFVEPVFQPFDVPSYLSQEAASASPFDSLPLPFTSMDCPAMSRPESDNLISSAAQHEDIPAELLRAVIKRESAFHPCAVSEKGALGLMQLMPATAEQFGVSDPFNPKQNVLGGAAFLKQLLTRFGGDVRLALGAYNAGPERVDAAGGVPDIAETQNYVSSIAADLGLPPAPDDSAGSAVPEREKPLTPPKAITNAMTKPDLRHLTLASPGLQFQTPATPAHLISGQ